MVQDELFPENESQHEPAGLVEKLEKEFDWNLILIVSVWLFLLATVFLLFIGQ